MMSNRRCAAHGVRVLLLLATAVAVCPLPTLADLMIIGNDEKVVFDAEGTRKFVAPGKDTISIVDITDREAPKILISFPLMNSIFGPPVNLAITPDERLAIVANSVDWIPDGASWKPGPDTKLYIFNLKTNPVRRLDSQGRRHEDHRHRQEAQAARPAGLHARSGSVARSATA